MAVQQVIRIEPEELRRSRRTARQTLDALNSHAERAELAEREATEVRATLQGLELAHPGLASPNLTHTSGNALLLALVIGTYVIDVVLFSATAEFYAGRVFSDSPALATITRFALPAALLVIELVVATHLHTAREEREETEQSFAYYGWLLVGGLFVIVMPASVIATHLAARPPEPSSVAEAAFNWQLVSLVLVALTAHAAVLFSGRQGHEAKTWALFGCRRTSLRRAVRRHEREQRRAANQVQRAYSRYMAFREAHNASYPDRRVAAGPFTRSARVLLNALAGYDVIVLDGAPRVDRHTPVADEDSEKPGVAPRVEPTAEGMEGDGLDVRNADTEVKP